MSTSSYAAQCRVDLQNQITLDGEQIEIAQADGDTAKMDGDNNLIIHGEKITLNAEQQAAIKAYRQKMND